MVSSPLPPIPANRLFISSNLSIIGAMSGSTVLWNSMLPKGDSRESSRKLCSPSFLQSHCLNDRSIKTAPHLSPFWLSKYAVKGRENRYHFRKRLPQFRALAPFVSLCKISSPKPYVCPESLQFSEYYEEDLLLSHHQHHKLQ